MSLPVAIVCRECSASTSAETADEAFSWLEDHRDECHSTVCPIHGRINGRYLKSCGGCRAGWAEWIRQYRERVSA